MNIRYHPPDQDADHDHHHEAVAAAVCKPSVGMKEKREKNRKLRITKEKERIIKRIFGILDLDPLHPPHTTVSFFCLTCKARASVPESRWGEAAISMSTSEHALPTGYKHMHKTSRTRGIFYPRFEWMFRAKDRTTAIQSVKRRRWGREGSSMIKSNTAVNSADDWGSGSAVGYDHSRDWYEEETSDRRKVSKYDFDWCCWMAMMQDMKEQIWREKEERRPKEELARMVRKKAHQSKAGSGMDGSGKRWCINGIAMNSTNTKSSIWSSEEINSSFLPLTILWSE